MVSNMIDQKTYSLIRELVPRVVVDLVILDPENRVLLGKRTNDPMKGSWFYPGGAIVKNELIDETIYRKLFEETGIKTIISKAFLGTQEWFLGEYHDIALTFIVVVDKTKVTPNTEHLELLWFDILPDLDPRVEHWINVARVDSSLRGKPVNRWKRC